MGSRSGQHSAGRSGAKMVADRCPKLKCARCTVGGERGAVGCHWCYKFSPSALRPVHGISRYLDIRARIVIQHATYSTRAIDVAVSLQRDATDALPSSTTRPIYICARASRVWRVERAAPELRLRAFLPHRQA